MEEKDTLVNVAAIDGRVMLIFEHDLKWISFSPAKAKELATVILDKVTKSELQVN